MASTRIRARYPEQVPQDLPFTVDAVEPVPPGTQFPDPVDPIVVHVKDPLDISTCISRLQSHRSGQNVVVKVATPALLRRPEFSAIIDEAGSDLFAIDVIDY
jgi:hypothetical protein